MACNDRCYKCDQPYSTHDDGFCEATQRVMLRPAAPQPKPRLQYHHTMILSFNAKDDVEALELMRDIRRAICNHGPQGKCSILTETLNETKEDAIIVRRVHSL